MIGVPKEYKQLVRVGAATLCWSVWRCRNSVIFAGDLLYNTLATHMGYPSAVYLAGRPCSGVSFFGAGGQGIFCPSTWVAV